MMIKKIARIVAMTALCSMVTPSVFATDTVLENPWVDSVSSLAARTDYTNTDNKNVLTLSGRPMTADLTGLVSQLSTLSDFVFPLPLPDGSFVDYRFKRSSVMASALAEKYPQIQTYTATDLSNANNTGRFDITPKGFHGMFKHEGRWVLIDPEYRTSPEQYLSYYSDNALPLSHRGADIVLEGPSAQLSARTESNSLAKTIAGASKRTYRIAISAAAEYVNFHGGTKADGLAAIVTTLNRVNGVFERDLSINFELVANNDLVIYTNAQTDPFSNSYGDLETNTSVLGGVIGVNEFDIGHVFNTNSGGLAALSGVCDPNHKARGVTGISTPTGDLFNIDYVSHEIGHQLGANHTFNTSNAFCGSHRNPGTAWEPGGGSSIMSYAGLCDDQDIQANTSAFFHIGSIEEMLAVTSAATCGVETVADNSLPEVDAGSDYVIPSNTPFKLSGFASDDDGDALSYLWEQVDLGSSSDTLDEMVDDGTRPLFRSWEFEAHGDRYFPRFQDVLVEHGYTTVGETYPNTNRDLTFRLTVRDGKGGVATDEAIVTVNHDAEAFRVTAPDENTDLLFGEELLIQWNVANTNMAPINCSLVEILLSDNAGISFDHVVVASTENDGEYSYLPPEELLENGRILVSCLDNVFFAVNSGEFQVTSTEVRESVVDSGGGGGFSWLLIPLFILTIRQRLTLR